MTVIFVRTGLYVGLPTDTKPTVNVITGSEFIDTNGDIYFYDSGTWRRKQTNGTLHVNPIIGPQTQARSRSLVAVTDIRQKAEWPLNADITRLTILINLPEYSVAYTGTAAAMGTTNVISAYSRGSFVISGLTAETVSVSGMIGATAAVQTAAIRVLDLATGALAGAGALGNGSYKLVDLSVRKLKFTKSAATESATVTLSMSLDKENDAVYAVISIDAENDTEADGNLGVSGNPPASSSADAQFISIPVGVYVDIPLVTRLINGAYGGGRIDVRSVDGTPLNAWIGAN